MNKFLKISIFATTFINTVMIRDFIAIDFETANQEPSCVCSVGVVMVRGGHVVDRFYSLIQPESNYLGFCEVEE
jgi:DNA polymerase III epsilon subunit-like protein